MANLFLQNNYEQGNQKTIKVIVITLIAAIVISLAIYFLSPASEQDKHTQKATEAAQKVTPNAKVNDIKVAGGFALALVSDPTSSSQAEAGNTTIFQVKDDGSMTQIANGSSFDTIQLLELGIPLKTQAELTNNTTDQVKQSLAIACGYNGGSTPGYSGFDGAFNPGGWKIDQLTLDVLDTSLTNAITKKNSTVNADKQIICVDTALIGSNITDDTYTIGLRFISSDGTLSKHTLSYTIESNYRRSFTLDDQKI